ncbi:MAG TPA: helix-turn-helix domain-containing protein [Flavobacteriia bacterium]|jgi:AraC-like DNA-binding protein|nr:helix-turn-helix domain-containing protein [Flavobacteriia bacterium]
MFETKEIHIKGMVCRRCIRVVTNELESLGAEIIAIELGKAVIKYPKDKITKESIRELLQKNDFDLLTGDETKIIEQIKILMVQMTDDLPILMKLNLSQIIANKIGKEYTYLSKLFSKVEGLTIEKYFIQLKIEKAKELIQDNQLNFTEIAYELGYSSVNYLSNQFKHSTGMNMSDYKKLSKWNRKSIDKIV